MVTKRSWLRLGTVGVHVLGATAFFQCSSTSIEGSQHAAATSDEPIAMGLNLSGDLRGSPTVLELAQGRRGYILEFTDTKTDNLESSIAKYCELSDRFRVIVRL